MKIGISGPLTLNMLNFDPKGQRIPKDEHSPMQSMLINLLISRGHQVTAYTNSFDIQHPVVFEGPNLRICIGRIYPHPGRRLFRAERQDLTALMQQYPSDIIHAQWSYEYAWAAIDSGIPTVVHLRDHATTILKYQLDPFRMARWIMNYIVIKKAKHLMTNSSYLYDLLTESEKKKAVVVSNFYGKSLENIYDNSLDGRKTVLSISSGFSKRKNIENALKAFSIVRKKFPQINYHIIGNDMEPEGPAFSFAKEHNLLEGVVFMGHQPFNSILEQMKQARVFLHPAREESFGLSVLEAMLTGTPVIGGKNSGNIPYLLNQGAAGLLVDVDSPDDIAEKVIALLSDKQESLNISQQAYDFAKTNFSGEVIVDKLINHYTAILSQYHKSSGKAAGLSLHV